MPLSLPIFGLELAMALKTNQRALFLNQDFGLIKSAFIQCNSKNNLTYDFCILSIHIIESHVEELHIKEHENIDFFTVSLLLLFLRISFD